MLRQTIKNGDEGASNKIEGGQYRNFYLVYNRKSTDDTDNQKNSIAYQKSANIRFALRNNLAIAPLNFEGFATVGIISERHSGFKEDLNLTFGQNNTVQYRVERPKFHRLVQWLSKGYFRGVIFLCWDRASRNKGDDTILRKLMKVGVDIRFTLAQYEKTSSGELHMDIDGMFAEHHSRVTREKVMMTFRSKREQGYWTNKAPVGYLNPGVMEHKPFDPIRAPIIRQLFEMAVTGDWSLADLARWAIQQGFTMPPVRRRRTIDEILAEEEDDVRVQIEAVSRLPTATNVHKILTNPFYKGMALGNDGARVLSSSHQALVSVALFDRVQQQLRKRNQSAHYAAVLDYPLRGVVRCAKCTRVYTPYTQKKVLYYGVRCKDRCANSVRSTKFDFIALKVGELISSLSFTAKELEEIDARAQTDIALLDTNRLKRLEAGERRKKRIREDLAYLNANRLMLLKTGAYTPENLAADEMALNRELANLCETEQVSDISMAETVREVVKLSELLKNVASYYNLANAQEKDRIIRIIFSELSLSENTLEYKCKKGFQSLANRFIPIGDPTGWLSELVVQQPYISQGIATLTEMLSRA